MSNKATGQAFTLKALIVPLLPTWLIAWSLGLLTAGSVLGLVMVAGWFITMAGLTGMMAMGAQSFNYLVPSALIRTFAISRTLGRYGDLVVSHEAIFRLLKQLRVRFFYEFTRLDTRTRQSVGSSTAQHRLVSDIDTLDEFPLRVVAPIIIVALSGTVLAFIVAWHLGGLFVLPFVLLWVVVLWAWRCDTKALGSLQEARQTNLLDKLPILPQLLLWERWQALSAQFMALDNQLSIVVASIQVRKRWAMLALQWLFAMTVIAVLLVGGQGLQSGQEVAILLALMLGLFAFVEIALTLVTEPAALGNSLLAKQRLNALLSAKADISLTPVPAQFSIHIEQLAAHQVGAVFGIQGIDVTLQFGQPLVIFGVSGAGKSTLLAVLAGELSATHGSLTLVTTNTKIPLNSVDWQGEFGFLGQRVDIFNRSLADNLRLGKTGATDDELWQVLELVGLKDWAIAQPKQLATALGEHGANVSGGQARRIALARLLLRPKKVLLLDEPFAGLDTASRQRLWTALRTRQANGILVVVSHHQDIITSEGVDTLAIGEPTPL